MQSAPMAELMVLDKCKTGSQASRRGPKPATGGLRGEAHGSQQTGVGD